MPITVTSEIFQVGGSGLTSHEDAAIYLIYMNEMGALVDAGCGNQMDKLFMNIQSCGVPLDHIRYLLLTHCHFDHTGGAKEIADRLGCKVICHDLDAEFLERGDQIVTAANWYGARLKPVDVHIKLKTSKETIAFGNRSILAIHVPGHSPGSVVFLVESDGQKVLFAQDVHGPIHSQLLSNREDYLYSLQTLVSIEADILCEGHYGIYNGKDEVRDFIESFM